MIDTAATVAESRLACAIKLCRVHYLRCVRFLTATVVAAAIALAGCVPGGTPAANNRHMQPLSERMLAELEAKNMEKESSILVRTSRKRQSSRSGNRTGQEGSHSFAPTRSAAGRDSSGPRSSKATARISAISGI
jgi:hypothetical protein